MRLARSRLEADGAWRGALLVFLACPFFNTPCKLLLREHGARRARPAPSARRRRRQRWRLHVLRRRTRASNDGLPDLRAPALRAGRRGHLSPLAHGRPDLSAAAGSRGRTLAPAPSDARFVSRLTLLARPGGAAAHTLTLALTRHLVRRTAREHLVTWSGLGLTLTTLTLTP